MNMDFTIRHWAPFPREFPSALPVSTVNFIEKKDHWIRSAFKSCNFSFVLRGGGELHYRGQSFLVEAPCVLTQWPRKYVEYGPLKPYDTWDELYLIYDARLMTAFKDCGFVDFHRPCWPIANLSRVMELAREMETLSHTPIPESAVDRMDRLCERMILESLLPPHERRNEDFSTQHVHAEIRRHINGKIDFSKIARRLGMSDSTFRRKWAQTMDLPPQRYLQNLRLREACRLLAETGSPVKEIAAAVGFDDQLYFSRKFHSAMGMSPRAYRHLHRLQQKG